MSQNNNFLLRNHTETIDLGVKTSEPTVYKRMELEPR